MALGAWLLAAPAVAQEAAPAPTLSIGFGETVTARITSDGHFVQLRRARGLPRGRQPANTIRFTFSELYAQRMLHIENGYDRIFGYRARKFTGGSAAEASICTVVARSSGIESLSDSVDRMELREPRFVDNPRDMRCE